MDLTYLFSREQLPELLIARYYPERTGRESMIIRDFLKARGHEYDRFAFSVRIGEGLTPDSNWLPSIQEMTRYNSRMRIDILAWQGAQPVIIEVKERVLHGTLGQLQTYAYLFQKENPAEPMPALVAIGRYSTPDTLEVLRVAGVTVYLYDAN